MGMNIHKSINSNCSLISINKLHKKLGHPHKKVTMNIAKEMGLTLTNEKMDMCEDCEKAKSIINDLSKINTNPATIVGERLYTDISWVKEPSGVTINTGYLLLTRCQTTVGVSSLMRKQTYQNKC